MTGRQGPDLAQLQAPAATRGGQRLRYRECASVLQNLRINSVMAGNATSMQMRRKSLKTKGHTPR